ncbi:hypothetical protein P175DRAFT_0529296 [Aspergillus ochraceoroseus IBT 24754]|uniref:Uncharacterized protein n=1 Tax=Aspergillus ochraceoroseus IBT 24754 TaxID=1392256 RepID=A0A2T5M154_9EURO|nr:uncharacterized protein P175DRAFT_0529296 [Aspergillus ochraceoroseus IBT 24754]PTU22258.1 hypothetical protein P175DRAFT_0529296 [Aspergillus ochraceoroseus IBT 24754]
MIVQANANSNQTPPPCFLHPSIINRRRSTSRFNVPTDTKNTRGSELQRRNPSPSPSNLKILASGTTFLELDKYALSFWSQEHEQWSAEAGKLGSARSFSRRVWILRMRLWRKSLNYWGHRAVIDLDIPWVPLRIGLDENEQADKCTSGDGAGSGRRRGSRGSRIELNKKMEGTQI